MTSTTTTISSMNINENDDKIKRLPKEIPPREKFNRPRRGYIHKICVFDITFFNNKIFNI